MDSIAAQRAMKLAKSYIDEVEDTPDRQNGKIRDTRSRLRRNNLTLRRKPTQTPRSKTANDIHHTHAPGAMLYKEARTWDKEDYSKAVQIAKKAVEADPDYVYAHHMLLSITGTGAKRTRRLLPSIAFSNSIPTISRLSNFATASNPSLLRR